MNKRLLTMLLPLLLRSRSPKVWGIVIVVGLLCFFVGPMLSNGVTTGGDRDADVASTSTGDSRPGIDLISGSSASSGSTGGASDDVSSAATMGDLVFKPAAPSETKSRSPRTKSEPVDTRPLLEVPKSAQSTTSQPTTSTANKKPAAKSQLGKLTEIGPKLFETTAGLVYGPGSVDGHRLLHLMEHAKDRPDKPVHGVFTGDEFQIRALVDEAYLIADLRGPPQAKKEVEGKRTIWKVDMKKKVGYLGGQVGKRKRNPSLTGIQLVLEGKNVITAYPIDPRR